MPNIKFKRCHPDAKLPVQADGDVGFDVFAVEDVEICRHGRALVKTGWMLAAEPVISGACIHGNLRSLLKVESRSGLALHEGLWVVGGIIDPSYRGEIGIIMHNSTPSSHLIRAGQKIAQLVWYPVVANWAEYGRQVTFEEVEHVEGSERHDGGFGSTGS